MRTAMHRRILVSLPLSVLVASIWSACGGTPTPLVATPGPSPSASVPAPAADRDASDGTVPLDAAQAPGPDGEAPDAQAQTQGPCPADMAHVVHDFCPKVDRKCIKKEKNKPNKITLCHKFQAGSTKCLEPRHHLDVADSGNVREDAFVGGEQTRRQQRQRGVLVAFDVDGSGQALAAFDE